MSEKDGDPAFPRGTDQYSNGHSGMTLRDWFAGMALQGLMPAHGMSPHPEDAAKQAYWVADAMLLARKERSDD